MSGSLNYLDKEKDKVIMQKDGTKIECDIIFTFECDDNSRTYVGYTDHSQTYNGAENIFVSSINFLTGNGTLEPVTTQEEINMVNEVLENIKRESMG